MKCFLRVVMFSFFLLAPSAWADGPDDTYVTIYTLIQQGDTLNEKGKPNAALAKYSQADSDLKRFQKANPGWNEKVVAYRLKYLAAKISQIQSNTPLPSAPEKALSSLPASNFASSTPTNIPVTLPKPVPAPAPAPVEAQSPAPVTVIPAGPEIQAQEKNLQNQIHQLESDKGLLEAKLKEALAAQPTPISPEEFSKAKEQVRSSEKENALLKATLTQIKSTNAAVSTVNVAALQQELSDAKRKVVQLTQDNATLTAEKTALQERIKALGVPDEATVALRAENALLKKQLAEVQTKVETMTPTEEMNRKLQAAQTQLAALQSDKELLQQEKLNLEKRVELLTATPPPQPAPAPAPETNTAPAVAAVEVATVPAVVPPTNAVTPPVTEKAPVLVVTNNGPITNLTASTNGAAEQAVPSIDDATAVRLAQLEAQRDELQKNISIAARDIYGKHKGKEMGERIQEMSRQLGMLRARIEVLEAHPIAYSSYELALMAAPGTTLSDAHPAEAKKPVEMKASTQVLLAEARRYFMARELDKAEERYLEAIKIDDKNASLFADLANIQSDLGKTQEAETNIHTAVTLNPDDDYVLYTLGKLKFQQKKYDEAFDALSRAGQINPHNATLQNLLGLTLSEKGLRGPAETAFRKAIQIDPGFTDAHINLAVVYITQQPPLAELARWHYQKAVAAGHRPNLKLEKMLEPANPPAGGTP